MWSRICADPSTEQNWGATPGTSEIFSIIENRTKIQSVETEEKNLDCFINELGQIFFVISKEFLHFFLKTIDTGMKARGLWSRICANPSTEQNWGATPGTSEIFSIIENRTKIQSVETEEKNLGLFYK